MNNGNQNGLIYRQLPQTVEDWRRLRQFFVGSKGFIPPPQLGVAAVVETPNDEIVGAAVLQMVPYLGPFKIHPDWRGRVNYLRIKQDIDGQFGKVGGSPLIIQGYIALTDDDQLIAMAETAKMKRLACVTFLNEIEEENGLPR